MQCIVYKRKADNESSLGMAIELSLEGSKKDSASLFV